MTLGTGNRNIQCIYKLCYVHVFTSFELILCFTLNISEQSLRDEGKPLFGSLASRQLDCLNALVKFAAVANQVIHPEVIKKHCITLLSGMSYLCIITCPFLRNLNWIIKYSAGITAVPYRQGVTRKSVPVGLGHTVAAWKRAICKFSQQILCVELKNSYIAVSLSVIHPYCGQRTTLNSNMVIVLQNKWAEFRV